MSGRWAESCPLQAPCARHFANSGHSTSRDLVPKEPVECWISARSTSSSQWSEWNPKENLTSLFNLTPNGRLELERTRVNVPSATKGLRPATAARADSAASSRRAAKNCARRGRRGSRPAPRSLERYRVQARSGLRPRAESTGGGRTARSNIYPDELCKTILQGTVRQMRRDGHHRFTRSRATWILRELAALRALTKNGRRMLGRQ